MSSKIVFSVDVEKDLHGTGYKSIREGLMKFEKICVKNDIKPTLFVVAETIKDNKEYFKRWNKMGWEISLHGLTHRRFDDMSYEEKENEIKESLKIFKKYLGIKPRGFRAPQHSIDEETLDLLEKNGFEYDSSFTPFNFLQILFFPRRLKTGMRLFFSKNKEHMIRKKLWEKPVRSLILPPVSLVVRILPEWAALFYFKLLKLFYKNPIFYAHSWDFIELKNSRIDKIFNHDKLLVKLERVMRNER